MYAVIQYYRSNKDSEMCYMKSFDDVNEAKLYAKKRAIKFYKKELGMKNMENINYNKKFKLLTYTENSEEELSEYTSFYIHKSICEYTLEDGADKHCFAVVARCKII